MFWKMKIDCLFIKSLNDLCFQDSKFSLNNDCKNDSVADRVCHKLMFVSDPEICRRAMDVVFLVDNTNSDATVTDNDFDDMKTFLKNLVDR